MPKKPPATTVAPTPQPPGRPTAHTDALAREICERIAGGESLRAICRDEHMPPEGTVRGWVLDDRGGFSAHYARARELQADGWADEIVDIADDGRNDWMERRRDGDTVLELNRENIDRSKLRVDTRKWILSKRLRATYGDRTEAHVEHSGGVTIVLSADEANL